MADEIDGFWSPLELDTLFETVGRMRHVDVGFVALVAVFGRRCARTDFGLLVAHLEEVAHRLEIERRVERHHHEAFKAEPGVLVRLHRVLHLERYFQCLVVVQCRLLSAQPMINFVGSLKQFLGRS